MTTDRPTIGTMLREARHRAGLSQTQVSDATGIMPQKISNAEAQGDVYPAILDRLARFYELDHDEVYAASGRIPPDLTAAIAGNLDAIRTVRRALDLPVMASTKGSAPPEEARSPRNDGESDE